MFVLKVYLWSKCSYMKLRKTLKGNVHLCSLLTFLFYSILFYSILLLGKSSQLYSHRLTALFEQRGHLQRKQSHLSLGTNRFTERIIHRSHKPKTDIFSLMIQLICCLFGTQMNLFTGSLRCQWRSQTLKAVESAVWVRAIFCLTMDQYLSLLSSCNWLRREKPERWWWGLVMNFKCTSW